MEKIKDYKGRYILTIGVIILIIAILSPIFSLKNANIEELKVEKGTLNISSIDFSEKVYTIDTNWDYYPNKLYTPEDFEKGNTIPSVSRETLKDPSSIPFGTHRLTILAQPNTYLTICGYGTDYSTKVFVDDVEMVSIGVVADNEEEHRACVNLITYPIFTGDDGKVQLIYQSSNFVHYEGGGLFGSYISTAQNIEDMKQADTINSLLFSGGLLVLAAYFLLKAVIMKKSLFLALAFSCFVVAFRDQNFFIVHFLPFNYNWYIAYRVCVLVVSLQMASVLLVLANIFKDTVNKNITRIYMLITLVVSILHFTISTFEQVSLYRAFGYISMPFLAYFAYCALKHYIKSRHFGFTDYLIALGYGILLISIVLEVYLINIIPAVARGGLAPMSMMFFALLIGASISLQAQEQEVELAEIRQKGKVLEQINTMNKDFLHKVAHELKTPLTVISGYAQLTGMQLERDTVDGKTPKNLATIKSEAQRLSDMVTKLMDYSSGKEKDLSTMESFPLERLFASVSAVASPICEKNFNEISFAEAKDLRIFGNFEMLLQVFLNLIINANKFTKKGKISIIWGETEDFTEFIVKDTGTGIEEKHKEYIFKKGYTTGSGNGLGLFITKEAIAVHGGEIKIKETSEKGTSFYFTIKK